MKWKTLWKLSGEFHLAVKIAKTLAFTKKISLKALKLGANQLFSIAFKVSSNNQSKPLWRLFCIKKSLDSE